MTELLDTAVEVRLDPTGALVAFRRQGSGGVPSSHPWRTVERTTARWVVDTDWWREPARREYRRCLIEGDECVELALDLDTGAWTLSRRYD